MQGGVRVFDSGWFYGCTAASFETFKNLRSFTFKPVRKPVKREAKFLAQFLFSWQQLQHLSVPGSVIAVGTGSKLEHLRSVEVSQASDLACVAKLLQLHPLLVALKVEVEKRSSNSGIDWHGVGFSELVKAAQHAHKMRAFTVSAAVSSVPLHDATQLLHACSHMPLLQVFSCSGVRAMEGPPTKSQAENVPPNMMQLSAFDECVAAFGSLLTGCKALQDVYLVLARLKKETCGNFVAALGAQLRQAPHSIRFQGVKSIAQPGDPAAWLPLPTMRG